MPLQTCVNEQAISLLYTLPNFVSVSMHSFSAIQAVRLQIDNKTREREWNYARGYFLLPFAFRHLLCVPSVVSFQVNNVCGARS